MGPVLIILMPMRCSKGLQLVTGKEEVSLLPFVNKDTAFIGGT